VLRFMDDVLQQWSTEEVCLKPETHIEAPIHLQYIYIRRARR